MNLLEILGNMWQFAACYCLMKCLRSMLIGAAVLALILLVRRVNRGRRADVNFYAMLFMIPAAFTGMSKLMFQKGIVYATVLICNHVKPIHGKIYFSVMTVLLVHVLWKNNRLKRQVRALPAWEDGGELERAVALVTGEAQDSADCLAAGAKRRRVIFRAAAEKIHSWQKRYLNRVSVYVTREPISPFSGGLARPFVVLPTRMLEGFPGEERKVILCHELVHLKEGHILWTWMYQLLKIYWWANPMIYLCDRLLREDMEKICDEQCIRYADVSCGTYGRTLLDMIALMQGVSPEGTLCFSERNDFQIMKKRIGSLVAFEKRRCVLGRRERHGVIFAGLFVATFAAVAATSYPKYTRLPDIVMYDENIKMLDNNSAELREAVNVSDGRLVIDKERFGELLSRIEVEGDYVYISFDTIMKVPGCGGCGNVGMVAVNDYEDIFYLSADGPESILQEFWLKFLV